MAKKNLIPVEMKLKGCIDSTADFLQREQLMDRELWKRFVDQYRNGLDGENRGWRGEYWGKMMRGAVLVYEYTKDPALYALLTETVRDMLTVMEADGRVSSYSRETEFDGWDMWSRKYVMLGMEYYLDICTDDALKDSIVSFLCALLDYIMLHIGPGKKCITAASRAWLGVNSSSILEPVVRLYRLSNNQKYLDFASYIVAEGGAEGVNIFELAYKNEVYPYQYGVSKAYEMMSCFEGLLEYALITGNEKHFTACVNFGKAVMESDVSIIGSSGCTHELFDHSTVRQTAYEPGVMQETCVTVTWIKFCSRLLAVTGDVVFADAMEKSFYNAYLGALNTQHNACDYIRERYVVKTPVDGLKDTFLPFDSYSPLRAGKRGQLVGGLQLLKDKSYYGCCTSIGAAGVGIMAKFMVMEYKNGISLEFYEKGSVNVCLNGRNIQLSIETDYPVGDTISITASEAVNLYLRIPAWCDAPEANCAYTIEDGYMLITDATCVALKLPMEVHPVLPQTWTEDVIWVSRENPPAGWSTTTPKTVYHNDDEDDFVAFTRGPLTLCADSRTGKSADSVFSPVMPPKAELSDVREIVSGESCLVRCELESTNGETITLVDYASAGKDWETDIAAWLRTK